MMEWYILAGIVTGILIVLFLMRLARQHDNRARNAGEWRAKEPGKWWLDDYSNR